MAARFATPPSNWRRFWLGLTWSGLVFATLPCRAEPPVAMQVPEWVADAVFYQIFPERFDNADPGNDPTRDTLEAEVPELAIVADLSLDRRLVCPRRLGAGSRGRLLRAWSVSSAVRR